MTSPVHSSITFWKSSKSSKEETVTDVISGRRALIYMAAFPNTVSNIDALRIDWGEQYLNLLQKIRRKEISMDKYEYKYLAYAKISMSEPIHT